jgi:hypothetical protein
MRYSYFYLNLAWLLGANIFTHRGQLITAEGRTLKNNSFSHNICTNTLTHGLIISQRIAYMYMGRGGCLRSLG